MTSVDDRHVKPAPLVDADAVPDGFGGHCEHGWVVADEDDAAGGRDGGLNDTNNVGDGETREQGPHGEVLEPSGRRRELVAECVVLHVNADKVVQPRRGEAQDT